jgi:hypothetical protein
MLPAGLIRLGDARNAGKVKVASARESHEMEETGKVREIKALPRAKRLAKSLFLFRAAADYLSVIGHRMQGELFILVNDADQHPHWTCILPTYNHGPKAPMAATQSIMTHILRINDANSCKPLLK